jgi:hypothetical protein
MAKKKYVPRLAWFKMNPDDFYEDYRTRRLTEREKSFWLAMCVKSFRLKGEIYADDTTVAAETGATIREAGTLIEKLLASGLLKQVHNRDKGPECKSDRMVTEYEEARQAYEKRQKAGKSSAEKNGINNLRLIKS